MTKVDEEFLPPVKSLLMTFEGNGISSSVTITKENYKNVNSLVEAETGTKKNKLISCIEGDQAYDWSDCLFEENERLDEQFLEKVFTDSELDDKLNLLILEGADLNMANLEEIETFNPNKTKMTFAEFILNKLSYNVEVSNNGNWKTNPVRISKQEAKDVVARCESIGINARIKSITESLSLKEAEDAVQKMYEDKEIIGMTTAKGNVIYAFLEYEETEKKNRKVNEELTVPQQHQKKIAISTLKMNDVGASMMGGMTKAEAREFLKNTCGYSDSQIANLEE